MPDVKRTLTYRRATWANVTSKQRLEDYIRLIHQRLTTTKARTFAYTEGEIVGLAWEPHEDVVLVHVAQYVPRESTSLVPLPSTDPSSNTRELNPPGDANFLRGDIMFLVAGDHLLLCPSGSREAVVGAYLESASDKLKLGSWAAQCSLDPVADISKIRLIKTEGVKRIRLDASLYEASLEYVGDVERTTVRQSVMGRLGQAIREYFSADPRLAEVGDKENISVHVEISYDRRRKGGAVGQRRMESIARHLIDENEGGFRILTNEDKVIQPDELKIRQILPLESSGNTINREAAWSALVDFYNELKSSGALHT